MDDLALYGGVTIACALVGGVAFFVTKVLRRKGRDHSLYSMARNGKHFTNGRKKKKANRVGCSRTKERNMTFRGCM